MSKGRSRVGGFGPETRSNYAPDTGILCRGLLRGGTQRYILLLVVAVSIHQRARRRQLPPPATDKTASIQIANFSNLSPTSFRHRRRECRPLTRFRNKASTLPRLASPTGFWEVNRDS